MPVKKVAKKATKKVAGGAAGSGHRGGRLGSISKFKESLKSGGGGAGYIWTIADGVTAVVRFLTEPDEWHELYQHFDPEAKTYYTCVGRDLGCSYCEAGDKASFKYLANVVDMSDRRVRALGIPRSVAEILLKRMNNFNTLTDRNYEISRDGSGINDTKYDVDYSPPTHVNPKKFEPLDLDAIISSQKPGTVAGVEEDEDEDGLYPPPPKKSKVKRNTIADDDDEDDEPRRPVKRVAKKVAPKRKFH